MKFRRKIFLWYYIILGSWLFRQQLTQIISYSGDETSQFKSTKKVLHASIDEKSTIMFQNRIFPSRNNTISHLIKVHTVYLHLFVTLQVTRKYTIRCKQGYSPDFLSSMINMTHIMFTMWRIWNINLQIKIRYYLKIFWL